MNVSDVTYTCMESPMGVILLAGGEAGLTHVSFQDGPNPVRPSPGWRRDRGGLREALDQLGAYFAGERTCFDLSLAADGTAFERQVWDALPAIPYGETRTYGDIAKYIGRPTAFRAVGAANARNPIAIVVPCHRVVGANGHLTGYAGGLRVKRALLDHESAKTRGKPGQLSLV